MGATSLTSANLASVLTEAGSGASKLQREHLLASAYYDWALGEHWSFFAGGGAGLARLSGHTTVLLSGSTTPGAGPITLVPLRINYRASQAFTCQGAFGLAYRASKKWTVTLDFRNAITGDTKFDGHTLKTGAITTAGVGVRLDL